LDCWTVGSKADMKVCNLVGWKAHLLVEMMADYLGFQLVVKLAAWTVVILVD
jgi:hypothetical protein